jgi:hypothetical protein
MPNNKKEKIAPPEIGPYVFPTLLLIFGLWCFYDGWLTSDPAMKEHLLLNRIGSIILLPWAIIDFIRTRKINRADKLSATSPNGSENERKS